MGQRTPYLVLWIVLTLSWWSCQDITGTIENPFDSSSPNFVDPVTEVISGPGNGITLDTASVTFQWRHADPTYWPDSTGNWDIAGQVLFTYRVNHTTWSPWLSGRDVLEQAPADWMFDTTTGIHSLTLRDLDDGDYEFEVRCKYPTEILEVNWPHRAFAINALVGPALILSPANIYADSGATFVVQNRLEDVQNVIGAHSLILWDPDYLALQSYEVHSDSTQFFFDSAADYLTDFTFVEANPDSGRLDVSIALAGTGVQGVSGSGILVRMIFHHVGPRGETNLHLDSSSDLRDAANQSLLHLTRDARVIIW